MTEEISEFDFSFSGIESSPAVVGNMVYVGSADGYIYGLDKNRGRLKWKSKIREWLNSSPAVSEGISYVGTIKGHIYAISTGEPNAPDWPIFMHDPQHTGCADV